ncbi:MAG: response regulator [Halobacteriaceae archaeon]
MTGAGNPRVLVVDDDTDVAELYSVYLSEEYDVRTATGGSEALRKADDTIDVALLDRRMPGMSGDEVLAELRERDIDCRVAMLTAVEPDTDIVAMPFDDYKVKPVDRGDLIGLVEVLLERAAYDERSQEFFSLASKKAALEVAGNDDTEEYDELVERIESVREEIDATLDSVSAEAAFREFADEGPG